MKRLLGLGAFKNAPIRKKLILSTWLVAIVPIVVIFAVVFFVFVNTGAESARRQAQLLLDKTVEEMLQRGYRGGKVVVSHCFNEDAAAYVQQKLKALFPSCEISILPTRGLCSYYAELGGILVGFET